MSRVAENPIKKLARAILALTIDQRNALEVAVEIGEEQQYGGAPKPATERGLRRRPTPKPKPAPEASNV